MLLCFIASQCGPLRVILKNNVVTFQGSCQGIYQPSSTVIVNGRPSWTSASRAIWYDQKNKNWKIGELVDIGTNIGRIKSEEVDELVDPENIVSWQYSLG